MFETSDRAILAILEEIQVPPSKYEAANRSFVSVCEWLSREQSRIARYEPSTSLQGSFRLGTAIRPLTEDDEYDVDIVCTLTKLTKSQISPVDLKASVGAEVKAYAERHGMCKPVEGRRCWTQTYADGSQFHIDTLPALPDPIRQRLLLEARGFTSEWVDSAIAITDKTDANYHVVSDRWPLSNPSGYASWFEAQMGSALQKRKEAIALNEAAAVDDIPTYRARVPLQSVVQLLKYHRDVMFSDDTGDKPISVIITTLAAQAYGGETSVLEALRRITANMHLYIEQEHGVDWVRNPTNSLENFADKWIEYPKRRENFYNWLRTVRNDLERVENASDANMRKALVEEAFGSELATRLSDNPSTSFKRYFDQAKLRLLGSVPHRKAPPWNANEQGKVQIYRAVWMRDGFRPNPFSSNGPSLRKGSKLSFLAKTDVPPPYEVYWQVVNTGLEAQNDNKLRGGFDQGTTHAGKLKYNDRTAYSGSHTLECFIVKSGYLAARSGQFIVNIA